MSLIFRIVSVVLLLGQALFLPLVSAQEAPAGEPPQTDVSDICVLPWSSYVEFTGYRLAYQTAIVDDELVFAEDLFSSMQDILLTNCESIASIVQVQAESLDDMCNNLLNHLLAKNKYFVTQLDADSAIATQGLISTVLQTQDCQSILSPASEFAIELIQEDIQANYTIDLDAMVIPWEANACFMQYGPAHAFVEQIERIQDQTVATSLFTMVNNYITQLSATVLDTIGQEREGVLLKFAKTIVGNKRGQYGFPSFPQVLGFQVNELGFLADSLSNSKGVESTMDMITNHMPDIMQYMDGITTLPYWESIQPQSMEAIIASFADAPVTLVWDAVQETFLVQAGDKGLTLVIPATQTQPQLQIRLIKLEGHRWTEEFDDGNGSISQEEDRVPTRIIADLWSDDEKIAAIDREASYDAAYNMQGGTVAIFMDPYIYTNQFTITRTDNENQSININSYDVRIFGPAGCDVALDWTHTKVFDNASGEETATHDLILHFNNTRIELTIDNPSLMREEIQAHRQLFPDATSAPGSNNYVQAFKIFFKANHIANIYASNNRWVAQFVADNDLVWFDNYINEVLEIYPIMESPLLGVLQLIISITADDKQAITDTSDDSISFENLMQCKTNDGYTPGYYYYPAQDSMVSSYCLPDHDNCGSYDYSVDGMDLYFRRTGPDTQTCINLDGYLDDTGDDTNNDNTDGDDQHNDDQDQGGSGYQDILGCTDPAANNHNADATTDDGSCSYGSQSSGSGCPDGDASNFDPDYAQNGNNRDACEYIR